MKKEDQIKLLARYFSNKRTEGEPYSHKFKELDDIFNKVLANKDSIVLSNHAVISHVMENTTLKTLIYLKDKIDNRTYTIEEDLENLDNILSIHINDKNYLLKQFKKKGISSYKEFIQERKKLYSERNPVVEGFLEGTIQGTFNILFKEYV